jgi:cell cycle sensor histidine kinase DivJ
VTDGEERKRQRRTIGTALAIPFLYAAAAAQGFAGHFDVATILAILCAILGAGWLAALAVAITARPALAEILMTAAAIAVSATVIAAVGGPASPLALLGAPLVLEPYWMRNSRAALMFGLAAATAAFAAQAGASEILFAAASGATASGWLWLLPAAYAASLWVRFGPAAQRSAAGEAPDQSLPIDVLDALVLTMTANGEVRNVSERAQAIAQLPPELLLADGFFERVHVSDRVAYLCALADLRGGAKSRKLDLRLRLPVTEAREPTSSYRLFAAELVNAGSERIMAIVRDNGEIARLRDALATAKEGLAGNEIAKSRFLAAVSHELRTPLNAIIGFSDMLLHETFGGFTDPRQKEYARLIRESGHHLLSVVNCILDVSKIESGAYPIHSEPFVFAEAVEMCRSMMAHQADAKGVALEARLDAGIGEIQGDRRAVQQILINLVSNAVKFTPEGGRVSISGRRLGSQLHFWVSDTGIGIAEEDLARLGEPFMQVQNDYTRRYDGTGLGLSLVKGLVALHEGTMSVESAPGQGTTVTISVPCEGPAVLDGPAKGELVPIIRGRRMEELDEALRKTA